MNQDLDEAAAYERAALLVAVAANQHHVPVPGGIVQHNHWSGKHCPRVLRDKPNGWEDFLTRVQQLHQGLRAPSAPVIADHHHDAEVAPDTAVELPTDDIAAVPKSDPVAFGVLPKAKSLFWPVLTSHPEALLVSYETSAGKIVGSTSRKFLADRANGTRYHVGIDIYCYEGDEVVALADGKIVNFYSFYTRPTTGEETYALFIAHDGVVCNYGEVKANSAQAYNWKVGDKVIAGQKIARVSGTNMIHFETYVPGTKANGRWMKNGQRPAALQNPTRLLWQLALSGIRTSPRGVIVASSLFQSGPANIAAPPHPAPSKPETPELGKADWHSRFGGEPWRYDERGVHTRLKSGLEQRWRTNGEPVTCRDIYKLFGPLVLDAAAKHGVNPALIMMTIATETGFARKQGFTGPQTFRWEAHVNNFDISPEVMGSYSAGPMQTLATTARETIKLFGGPYKLNYDGFAIAPVIKARPTTAPVQHPLYDAWTSIDLGAAEIRRRFAKTGDDPILVAAAYNSGGLYESGSSNWGLRAHGDHLDRAAAWYGDACSVLSEHGVV